MSSASTPDLRRAFARKIVAQAGVRDPRIEDAFAQTAREKFAGPPPWFVARHGEYVETSDLADLYEDCLVAIDAPRGINIGEPALHARCMAELDLKAGETILHVGAGVGYYTAMLARLVGETGNTLHRIAEQVLEMSTDIEDIAAQAREEAVALRQLSVAADEMDAMTQQNAAMAEQATATSHSLGAEAAELSSLVRSFRISGVAAAPAKAAAPADTAAAPAVRPRPSPAIAMQKRVASAFAPAGQARAAADEDWTEF